jgi:hypothetical protein
MRKYVQNALLNDESSVYETRLHWVTLVSLRAAFTLFFRTRLLVAGPANCYYQQTGRYQGWSCLKAYPG